MRGRNEEGTDKEESEDEEGSGDDESDEQRWKKGWKPGKNCPESFHVWQKVLEQIIQVMSHILITSKMDLKSGPFTDYYVCHSYHFHISEEIKVSFFKRPNFLSAGTFLHLYSVSAIKL